MSAPRFRRQGMCAVLMERKWQSAHSRRFAACLHRALERTPPWWFMYETTDVLSVRISACRYSSCGQKSFRAKNTASSSKRFTRTDSGALTTAPKPACPRTLFPSRESMRRGKSSSCEDICIFIERPVWQLLLHCPLRLFPGPGHTFLIASGSRLGAAATTADLSFLLWCGQVADDDLERDGGWNKHSRFFQKHLVVCVPKVS